DELPLDQDPLRSSGSGSACEQVEPPRLLAVPASLGLVVRLPDPLEFASARFELGAAQLAVVPDAGPGKLRLLECRGLPEGGGDEAGARRAVPAPAVALPLAHLALHRVCRYLGEPEQDLPHHGVPDDLIAGLDSRRALDVGAVADRVLAPP